MSMFTLLIEPGVSSVQPRLKLVSQALCGPLSPAAASPCSDQGPALTCELVALAPEAAIPLTKRWQLGAPALWKGPSQRPMTHVQQRQVLEAAVLAPLRRQSAYSHSSLLVTLCD